MRVFCKIATAAARVMFLGSAHAAASKVVVFDSEFVDTSVEGATYGPRSDQHGRLAEITDFRDQLAKSRRVTAADVTPVGAQARAADLRNRGYDVQFEALWGADRTVQNVSNQILIMNSNLILNMNAIVTDAKAGRVISVKSVDTRRNTDESWSRPIDRLVRYDLLAPPGQGVFQ